MVMAPSAQSGAQTVQRKIVNSEPLRRLRAKNPLAFCSFLIAGLMAVLIDGLARGDQPAVEVVKNGVVFAINGSGNFQLTSTALERAVEEAGLPLSVVTFEWSQGSVVADHTDWQRAQEQGHR